MGFFDAGLEPLDGLGALRGVGGDGVEQRGLKGWRKRGDGVFDKTLGVAGPGFEGFRREQLGGEHAEGVHVAGGLEEGAALGGANLGWEEGAVKEGGALICGKVAAQDPRVHKIRDFHSPVRGDVDAIRGERAVDEVGVVGEGGGFAEVVDEVEGGFGGERAFVLVAAALEIGGDGLAVDGFGRQEKVIALACKPIHLGKVAVLDSRCVFDLLQ